MIRDKRLVRRLTIDGRPMSTRSNDSPMGVWALVRLGRTDERGLNRSDAWTKVEESESVETLRERLMALDDATYSVFRGKYRQAAHRTARHAIVLV